MKQLISLLSFLLLACLAAGQERILRYRLNELEVNNTSSLASWRGRDASSAVLVQNGTDVHVHPRVLKFAMNIYNEVYYS